MHDAVRLGERVVISGEELLLVVVVGSPGQHTGGVQGLAQNLAYHVSRLHALGGVYIVRAARGVDMMVAGVPSVLRGVDPTVKLEGDLVRTALAGIEFASMRNIFRASRVLHRVVSGRQLHSFAIGPVDLRLEEKIGCQALGGQ